MASFIKRGKMWRVEIRKANPPFYATDTFPTKQEGVIWATRIESEWYAQKRGNVPNKPFRALLERYGEDVSVKKAGARWEKIRLALIGRDPIGDVPLPQLNSTHFVAWRDRRLKQVSAASVRREWNLLSNALNIAVKEWHWLKENPLKDVARPAAPEARDRLITKNEIDRICLALGFDGVSVNNKSQRVAAAFMFAIETGMRAGEICGIRLEHITGNVCLLPMTKNGSSRRVPLSSEAVRLLEVVGGWFELEPAQLDGLFRKGKGLADVHGITFHDTRHLAITRLAKKLNVLDLARMVGHRNLKQLQIYFNESAEDIAGRLN